MTCLHYVRVALRSIQRSRQFSLVIVTTLGVGLGVGGTLFGLVDRLLFRPPPHVKAPHRIVRLGLAEENPFMGQLIAMPLAAIDYEMIRRYAGGFEGVAAYLHVNQSLGRGLGATPIRVVIASPSFFDVLGVDPALGRFYRDEDDAVGASVVPCVASDAFWRREFGGSVGALGRQLLVGSLRCILVGVTPTDFTGVDLESVDLWVPLRAGARDVVGSDPELWSSDRSQWLMVIGRMEPGVTLSQASEYATLAYRGFVGRHRDPNLRARVVALTVLDFRSTSRQLGLKVTEWLAGGAAVFLALISLNLISLSLARNLTRRHDTAVRLALGGSLRSTFLLFFSECFILGLFGACIAFPIIASLGRVTRSTLFPNSTWVQGPLDLRVSLLSLGLAIVIGGAVAIVTTLRTGELNVAQLLRSASAPHTTGGRWHHRSQTILVRIQAALAMVLLAISVSFVKSMRNAKRVDLGFGFDHLIVAQSPLAIAGYSRAQQWQFYRELYDRVWGLPGVVSASLGYTNPWRNTRDEEVSIPGRDSLPAVPGFGNPAFDAVTPDYLTTMHMRLVTGRWISRDDSRGSTPVMVINQALGELYWPGHNAVGECLRVGPGRFPCREIVGVVANHRFIGDLFSHPLPAYFLPLAQSEDYDFVPRLFVLSRGESRSLIPIIRRLFQDNASLPAADVHSMNSQIESLIAPWRLALFAFTAIGFLAAVVAFLGLFSVQSLMVSDREREYAIRSAVGAQPAEVLRSVLRRGVVTVAEGVVLGTIVVLVGAPWVQPMLFQTTIADASSLGVVASLLLVAGIGASYPAARRAAGLRPMNALRE
jgi:predicted permease